VMIFNTNINKQLTNYISLSKHAETQKTITCHDLAAPVYTPFANMT